MTHQLKSKLSKISRVFLAAINQIFPTVEFHINKTNGKCYAKYKERSRVSDLGEVGIGLSLWGCMRHNPHPGVFRKKRFVLGGAQDSTIPARQIRERRGIALWPRTSTKPRLAMACWNAAGREQGRLRHSSASTCNKSCIQGEHPSPGRLGLARSRGERCLGLPRDVFFRPTLLLSLWSPRTPP